MRKTLLALAACGLTLGLSASSCTPKDPCAVLGAPTALDRQAAAQTPARGIEIDLDEDTECDLDVGAGRWVRER